MPYEVLLKYPFVLLTGFVVTLVLTPVMRRLGPVIGMVDRPRERHLHAQPTPTGGGIAVFFGFHAACFALFMLPWASFAGSLDIVWWWNLLLPSGLLLILGVVDDFVDLGPWSKLVGQVAVALLAYCFDMRVAFILGVDLPLVIDIVLTVFWFVAIINAFNLIDGMDGLATGLAVIAAVGLTGSFMIRHAPADALVLLGFIGACLAFLRYNFYPASVFLGDSGSMFLGFILAAVALKSGAKGTAVTTIVVPLLAVGVPVFDAFLAVWRRSVRRILGRKETADRAEGTAGVFAGDADHVHHRLLRSGLSHRATATWLYVFSVGLVAVGLFSMLHHGHAIAIYVMAFVATTYIVVRHLAHIELWDSGRAIVTGLRLPSNRMLPVILYPLVDAACLALALAVALAFLDRCDSWISYKRAWVDALAVWVGVPFLCLFAARIYSRVWSRARISEFFQLGTVLLAAMILAAGLTSMVDILSLHDLLLVFVVHTGIAVTLIAGIRSVPRAVQDALAWHHRDPKSSGQPARRVLLVGTGRRAILYLVEQSYSASGAADAATVVGLVDEDRNLHGRYVYGYRVQGDIAGMADMVRKLNVEQIVVADELSEGQVGAVRAAAARHGVKLAWWKVSIEDERREATDATDAVDPGSGDG